MEIKYRHKRLSRLEFEYMETRLEWARSFASRHRDRHGLDGVTAELLRQHAKSYSPSRLPHPFMPHERGGITTCELIEDGEVVARGVAYCSLKDNFCYRVGREIALGRARKELNGREVSID